MRSKRKTRSRPVELALKGARLAGIALVRRQLRTIRAELTIGVVALTAVATGLRWAWRRRTAVQPTPVA